MAKKNGDISVREFEAAVKGKRVLSTEKEWNGIRIKIKRYLNIAEMYKFIETVVNSCFDKDSGEYVPESRDFAMRACIVLFYSNITLPSNLSTMYDCLYQSDIAEFISDSVDKLQFNVILDAINSKITGIVNTNISAINSQMEGINNAIETLGEQFKGLFDGVSTEDISAIFSAINSGNIDENKLMSALLETKYTKDESIA